jgi:hypothetical protein
MRLFGILYTLAAVIGAAVADAANPILTPAYGQNTLAGQSLSITWTPTSPGPITLSLRFGSTSSLSSPTEIASELFYFIATHSNRERHTNVDSSQTGLRIRARSHGLCQRILALGGTP